MAKTSKTSSSKVLSNGAAKTPAKPDAASGLKDLFEDQLKDIYWAEKALTKALPKMIKNASSLKLKNALMDHLEVTDDQVDRCEEIFASLGKKAIGKKCEAMEGLLKECTSIIESTEPGSVRDAGIICASQKVEHYEIASYGTLLAWAKQLGETKIAGLLEQTLKEEKQADITLSDLAETNINEKAEERDNNTQVKSKTKNRNK